MRSDRTKKGWSGCRTGRSTAPPAFPRPRWGNRSSVSPPPTRTSFPATSECEPSSARSKTAFTPAGVSLPLRRPGRVRWDRHGAPRDALLPPLREIVADLVESVAEAHALDGLVLLTNCDKITPGMLMAAARLDIPCIVLTAGPMHSGRIGKPAPVAGLRHLRGGRPLPAGRDRRGGLSRLEAEACPGEGVVPGALHREHDGVPDRDDGDVPPRVRHGPRGDVEEAAHGLRERASGGGTRAQERDRAEDPDEGGFRQRDPRRPGAGRFLELGAPPAGDRPRGGVDLPLSEFDRLSRETPQLTTVTPGGPHMMEDVEYSGGIPAILNRLLPFLKKNPTVSGEEITAIARRGRVLDDGIIRTLKAPVRKEGGAGDPHGGTSPRGRGRQAVRGRPVDVRLPGEGARLRLRGSGDGGDHGGQDPPRLGRGHPVRGSPRRPRDAGDALPPRRRSWGWGWGRRSR